jgi:2-(1,2-epoxy-1,2-dihydrophenyl)acetyl-CoA isomerase
MAFETIRFETSDRIALITLNRPDNMNTFNIVMLQELIGVFETAALDPEIRAVVLTGEGRAFSAGADVKGVDELLGIKAKRKENEDIMKSVNRLVLLMRQTPKPVIAAVNGVAAGASANFVLACDIIVASEKARFAENFINIGLVPDGGGTFFVPELVGYHRAAEIFFTGKILTAHEALALGLYNRVVAPEDVLNTAMALAGELSEKAPLALAAGKSILNREIIPRLRRYLEDEAVYQRSMAGTQDAREGMTAFIEKRKPNFTGQ